MRRLTILVCLVMLVDARKLHHDESASINFSTEPTNLGWLFGLDPLPTIENDGHTSVCETQECNLIARILNNSMDTTVNPCDDFYEYACGNWDEQNSPPDDLPSWNIWTMASSKVLVKLYKIASEKVKSDDILAVRLAKKWFSACAGKGVSNILSFPQLLKTIRRIGGWPMALEGADWDEEEYDWQKVDAYYAHLMGKSIVHDLLVGKDDDLDSMVIGVLVPHLPPGADELWAEIGDNKDQDSEEDVHVGEKMDGDERSMRIRHGKNKRRNYDADDDASEGSQNSSDVENNDDDSKSDEGNEDDDDDDDDYDDQENQSDDEEEGDEKGDGKLRAMKKKVKRRKLDKIHSTRERNNDKHARRKLRTIPNKGERRIKREAATSEIVHSLRRHGGVRVNRHGKKNRHSKAETRQGGRRGRTKNSKDHVETTENADENDNNVEDSPKLQEYREYIKKVAQLIALGNNITNDRLNKDIEDMIEFQLKLTAIIKQPASIENMTDLESMQRWYDQFNSSTTKSKINWVVKIKDLFDDANVNIDDTPHLIGIPHGDYFKLLPIVLDETSPRTIVNYIHWNFISRLARTTTKAMRDLYNQWMSVKEGDSLTRRLFYCLEEGDVKNILTYEYVKRHFSDSQIPKSVTDMIDDIQKEVEYQIKDSEWMDEDTKDFALAKLVNMHRLIGYPDWYSNVTLVNEFFGDMPVSTSYFNNTIDYYKFSMQRELRKLPKKGKVVEMWDVNPLVVNGLFQPEKNSLTIPMADLQKPFFTLRQPNTINFGLIGFIMAHEVNHGFDGTGFVYNKKGNKMEWLTAMANAYNKRAECFVNQYNKYSVVRNVNVTLENYGNQTVDENIADTMGLQAVYRAYARRERECRNSSPTLPGFHKFTNDQVFFLAFANLWCETKDRDAILTQAQDDEHSTGRLRIIGSLSNSDDFATAFNCPVGSRMNPKKKCNIWK